MSISTASASGSSRSARPWACRRPRTTSVPAASAPSGRSRMSGCSEVIRVTHKQNYEAYGYRRMWKALERAGEHVPRCQVQRLMACHGIQGAKRRGKPWRTTKTDPGALRAPDLVKRDFAAERPNALWVADFTYLRCWEGVLYYSFVLDVFSRMVVGWQLASNMRRTLVLDALRMALGLRDHGADVALVHHSDAGSQYTSEDYTQTLDDHLVLASIGTGRRRSGQRARRVVRRFLQDRADRRPRLALPSAGRARDRRLGRVVQPRPAALLARRHPTSRVRTTPRRRDRAHNAPRLDGRRRFRGQPPDLSRERSRAPNRDPLRPRQRQSRDERPWVASPTGSRGDILTDRNIKTNNTNDRGTHLTQSPSNPVRLRTPPSDGK